MIAYEIRRNHLIEATVRHEDKDDTENQITVISRVYSLVSINAQLSNQIFN